MDLRNLVGVFSFPVIWRDEEVWIFAWFIVFGLYSWLQGLRLPGWFERKVRGRRKGGEVLGGGLRLLEGAR
jgi:hypothetical protein